PIRANQLPGSGPTSGRCSKAFATAKVVRTASGANARSNNRLRTYSTHDGPTAVFPPVKERGGAAAAKEATKPGIPAATAQAKTQGHMARISGAIEVPSKVACPT